MNEYANRLTDLMDAVDAALEESLEESEADEDE
jgi:hypothetical protein